MQSWARSKLEEGKRKAKALSNENKVRSPSKHLIVLCSALAKQELHLHLNCIKETTQECLRFEPVTEKKAYAALACYGKTEFNINSIKFMKTKN